MAVPKTRYSWNGKHFGKFPLSAPKRRASACISIYPCYLLFEMIKSEVYRIISSEVYRIISDFAPLL
jgi:hypothetical protein